LGAGLGAGLELKKLLRASVMALGAISISFVAAILGGGGVEMAGLTGSAGLALGAAGLLAPKIFAKGDDASSFLVSFLATTGGGDLTTGATFLTGAGGATII